MFLFYRLLDVLTILGQKVDCYKVSLECKDDVVKFYQQFGFGHPSVLSKLKTNTLTWGIDGYYYTFVTITTNK
jgi:hypothetical protein